MANYYDSCSIPKSRSNKKKKACNGYKNKKNRYCYYCGTPYAERHEVYGGPNRQKSILNKWQVDLCHDCHEEMQTNITERAKRRNLYWRQKFQREYEAKLILSGITPEQARDLWIKEVGRSYLDV